MDRVRPGPDGSLDHRRHVEVTADRDRRVRHPGRDRVRVRPRNRQHGLDAEAPAGPDNPDGDLTPVGDEHPPQDHSPALIRRSAAPCATSSAFVTQNSATPPATPAGTEFISFIVSPLPITVSAPTRLPTSANGPAPRRRP